MKNSHSAPRDKSVSRVLISDFDGTMTRYGLIEIIQARYPVDGPPLWDDYMAGKITHFEAVAGIFLRIRGKEGELESLLQAMELDPALPGAIRQLEASGWQVMVASAGCHWYIQKLLSQAGLSLRVYANPGYYDAEKGLVMTMPPPSVDTLPETGINKLAVVNKALADGAVVAYAGDGKPDIESILTVPSDRRFARHWLARHLKQAGHPFQEFESWNDIASRLAL